MSRRLVLQDARGGAAACGVAGDRERLTIEIGGDEHAVSVLAMDPGRIVLEVDGRVLEGAWCFRNGGLEIGWHGRRFLIQADGGRRRQETGGSLDGDVTAPMTGRVTEVLVADGDVVEQGQDLLVVEAMKMEHRLTAPRAARVARVEVASGDLVDIGRILVHLEGPGDDGTQDP